MQLSPHDNKQHSTSRTKNAKEIQLSRARSSNVGTEDRTTIHLNQTGLQKHRNTTRGEVHACTGDMLPALSTCGGNPRAIAAHIQRKQQPDMQTMSTRRITRSPGTGGSPAHHFTPLLGHQAAPGGERGGRRGDGSLRLRALHARRLGDHLPSRWVDHLHSSGAWLTPVDVR